MTKNELIELLQQTEDDSEIVVFDRNTNTETGIEHFSYYWTTAGHKQYYIQIDTEDII
jgi:hypothetical protein